MLWVACARNQQNPSLMQVALRAMGFPIKKSQVAELMAKHGEEATESLDFETFQTIVSDRLSERTPAVGIQQASRGGILLIQLSHFGVGLRHGSTVTVFLQWFGDRLLRPVWLSLVEAF